MEGSLFLLKRATTPRFCMMSLNKLSTDNYVESIHEAFDFEVQEPYLMYTHGNSEIHGIWFYDKSDLENVSNSLTKVKTGLSKAPAPSPSPAPPPPKLPAPHPALEADSEESDVAFWDK